MRSGRLGVIVRTNRFTTMNFLERIFGTRRTCVECALLEKQVDFMNEWIMEERRAKWAAQDGAAWGLQLKAENEALSRELIMVRMQLADLREYSRRTYQKLAKSYRAVMTEREGLLADLREAREGKAGCTGAECNSAVLGETQSTTITP